MWTLLLTLAIPLGAQQAPPASAPAAEEARSYVIFVQGAPLGREEVRVRVDATGTTITSRGVINAPVNLATRQAEVHYRPDWTPDTLVLDRTLGAAETSLRTTIADNVATSQGTDAGRAVAEQQMLTGRVFVLPQTMFGAYEALGRYLAGAAEKTGEFYAFIEPAGGLPLHVRSVTADVMQSGTTTISVRRYELAMVNPAGELTFSLSTDDRGSLVRLNVPTQGIDVLREDLAVTTARTQLHANPGDEPVVIPSSGFNLGATLTRPANPPAGGRLPAVILLAGSGASDRDGFALGIPIIGQLAGSLADAGFLTVRYDKRGTGQSGGRPEAATLSDYAEDARTVVNWLSRRRDVDPKRIAVIGHSEGAWVALLLATREKKVAAVAMIAAPSLTGAEMILEQQAHALDRLQMAPEERAERVALQKKIQTAVLTGTGWEGVPPVMRRQADTPLFQSLLAYNPATVVDDVRQPMLFVHGELDRQVPVAHLERMATLARATSKSKSIEVVSVRGINHLLVPAATGEVSEYTTLTDRTVSQEVKTALGAWLTRTFAAIR